MKQQNSKWMLLALTVAAIVTYLIQPLRAELPKRRRRWAARPSVTRWSFRTATIRLRRIRASLLSAAVPDHEYSRQRLESQLACRG